MNQSLLLYLPGQIGEGNGRGWRITMRLDLELPIADVVPAAEFVTDVVQYACRRKAYGFMQRNTRRVRQRDHGVGIEIALPRQNRKQPLVKPAGYSQASSACIDVNRYFRRPLVRRPWPVST